MKQLNNVNNENTDITICQDENVEKVLGIWWCTKDDTFQFRVKCNLKNTKIINEKKRPTKRELLRIVMGIYDPLGLIANILIYVKVLLQDVWKSNIDWDDVIDDELFERWEQWINLLYKLELVKIPRCYSINCNSTTIELHILVDASEKAYAAVGYFRTADNGVVNVTMIGAKTRVAPLKLLSIPRLELEACVLGARLSKSITENHSFQIESCTFWSDSKTALGWIKSNHRNYKHFVAFRVAEILDHSESRQWRYIPSALNTADKATKWNKNLSLSNINDWFNGPTFLTKSSDEWPIDLSTNAPEEEFITTGYYQI